MRCCDTIKIKSWWIPTVKGYVEFESWPYMIIEFKQKFYSLGYTRREVTESVENYYCKY